VGAWVAGWCVGRLKVVCGVWVGVGGCVRERGEREVERVRADAAAARRQAQLVGVLVVYVVCVDECVPLVRCGCLMHLPRPCAFALAEQASAAMVYIYNL
jgi:hypothetical protein